MSITFRKTALLALVGAAAPAFAQDSVSNSFGLPGDALSPYDTNVQVADYVVTAIPFTSSTGNNFQVAPILKSSKASADFFSSLTSAQSISNRTIFDVPFAAQSYDTWDGAGPGVNPTENDAPNSIAPPAAGAQFSVGQAEFSDNYNGIPGAIVNYDPANAAELFVRRVVGATNGLSDSENRSQFGFGTIDANGNMGFRADEGFGGSAVFGPNPISGNNLFRVDLATRNASAVNFIDLSGGNDAGATTDVLRNFGNVATPPSILPEGVGSGPLAYSATFDTNVFVEGSGFTINHRSPDAPDHRGPVRFSQVIAIPDPGAVGTGAVLGKDPSDTFTDSLVLWSLDASGNPISNLDLTLPLGTSSDPIDPISFTGSDFEFFLYRSQVAFRGGNAPIAVGEDASGNILAAGVGFNEVIIPDFAGQDFNPCNTIFAARFDKTDPANTTEWSVIAWFDCATQTGKPVIGAGGAQIGRIASFLEFSDTITGPTMSAPGFDAGGNAYFVAPVLFFGDDGQPGTADDDFDVTLIRGIYDETAFGWRLEKLISAGDIFTGADSGVDFQVQFISLVDSNSIASGAFWSSNVNQTPFNDVDVSTLDAGDPNALGGAVFSVEIVYDVDADGDFDDPTATDGDPTSGDQSYNTLLFISPGTALPCPPDFDDNGQVDAADLSVLLANWGVPVNPATDLAGNDNVVNAADLSVLLAFWGPCP